MHTEAGSSIERSQIIPPVRTWKPRAIFDLVGTNNVDRIEKMLESNTGAQSKIDLMRCRLLAKEEGHEQEDELKKPEILKSHLRPEKNRFDSSLNYKRRVREYKRRILEHGVNVGMKGVAMSEY